MRDLERVEWFAGAVPSGRDVKTFGGGVAEQSGVQCWPSRTASCMEIARSCAEGGKDRDVFGGM